MPNMRKTEVRIVGSSGAVFDRAAHPVLGTRFSRLAALAKVAVFKKGDAECSVQSTYHPGAENGLHWKTVVRIWSVTIDAGESHHRVPVNGYEKKSKGQRTSLPAK